MNQPLNPLQLFVTQVTEFSRKNYWIYFMFLLAAGLIFFSQKGNTTEAIAIFSFHFLADIFMMMMVYEYTHRNYLPGTAFQIAGAAIFFGIMLYSGLVHGSWHYLASEILYISAAYKNYSLHMRKKDIPWLNAESGTIISIVVILGFYWPVFGFVSVTQVIQTIGIFGFAVGLLCTTNEKKRFLIGYFSLVPMILGSLGEFVRTFEMGNAQGLALSYTLLPLTVWFLYVKLWRTMFPRPSLQ